MVSLEFIWAYFSLVLSVTKFCLLFINFRVYQQVGDLGLFLFNDALVIATLTFKFVPFQRLVQRNYK